MDSPKKVAVLGFDCALTTLVDKHIEEGILPNFAKVFKNGVVCDNCLVPYPTITPPNWTSIATATIERHRQRLRPFTIPARNRRPERLRAKKLKHS